jgi:hypothetical protein
MSDRISDNQEDKGHATGCSIRDTSRTETENKSGWFVRLGWPKMDNSQDVGNG